MDIIINLISWALLIIGGSFLIIGGIGMNRFPDLYTRIHAVSVTDTGGITFVLLGLLVQAVFIFLDPIAAVKLLLIGFFMFFTGPTASHALSKAALMNNVEPVCPSGSTAVHKNMQETDQQTQTKEQADD